MPTKEGLIRADDTPKEAWEVAGRRVLPHLLHLNVVNFDLNALARNCYLQGLRDTAEMLIERGVIPPGPTPQYLLPAEDESSC